ncbi:hypothetical protein M569_13516, partial [Genlisea aurea]
MVGIFSRFSVRGSHRRTQSAAADGREGGAPGSGRKAAAASCRENISSAVGFPHGIEIAMEFKPVERPTEPPDNDQPIHCPLPEPSILNDGRVWKERRLSSSKEQNLAETQSLSARKPPRPPPNRPIMPSISAPEHNILKLLDESGAS